MKITEQCKNEIFEKSALEDVVGELVDLKGRNSLKGKCPFCDDKKKFSVNKKEQIWKCFACDRGGKHSVSFIMNLKNLKYPDALSYLADRSNITMEYEKDTKPLPQQKPKKEEIIKGEEKKSFRDEQLAASGLMNVDQKFKKSIEGTKDYVEIDRYTKGTINEKWQIVDGDDMILHYMDLNGKPMMYHPEKRAKDYPMFRIRWSNPEAHKDKHGKPIKYQSPYQSGSHLWINEIIRQRFQNNSPFDTLYMTEGEKKADKATKHGMYSVGIGGINNIANNQQLPSQFQWIIKNCEVKNVVFILDSDWNDISDNADKPIDQRPRQFLSALRSFLDYFNTFNNMGIYLNLYFAYPKKEQKEKGIDDLLVKLKGKENEILEDFKKTMNEADGKGKYINCHKLSGFNEFKLKELFHLNNNEEFVKHHYEKIKGWPIFQLGKEKFKLSTPEEYPDKVEGSLVLAQPLSAEEEYWEEKQARGGIQVYFHHTRAYRFLHNRRFGRYQVNGPVTRYVHIDGNVVREVEPGEIKDYVVDFTENVLQKANLLEAIYRGHRTYLGPDSLSNLKFMKPKFHRSDKGLQYLYFSKTYLRIDSKGIEEKTLAELDGHVWEDKLNDFDFKLLAPIIKVESTKNDKGEIKYSILTPAKDVKGNPLSDQCHFAKFLFNTSNFYWEANGDGYAKKQNPKKNYRDLTELEMEDITMHFISKCTAIGYMLHSYFDASVTKAVIAMDGKISEVNSSNGRSGKSLIGEALARVVPTEKINGKRKDLTEDKFLFENVSEKTRVVFMDDVRVNFDFEHFFPNITGIWVIEGKGKQRFHIAREDSPKLYIPTNHAINGDGGSFNDRQFIIAFSDYFNDNYKPIDEFGCLFFDEWDSIQDNLFYNLMANCVQIYFEHGLVSAPMGMIEQRKLRQQIGENFLSWAEDYYDSNAKYGEDGSPMLDRPINRNEVTEAFYTAFPEQKKYTNRRDVKKKLKQFCNYKKYVFNPGKPLNDSQNWGGDDKSGGVEYFTVSTEKLNKNQ